MVSPKPSTPIERGKTSQKKKSQIMSEDTEKEGGSLDVCIETAVEEEKDEERVNESQTESESKRASLDDEELLLLEEEDLVDCDVEMDNEGDVAGKMDEKCNNDVEMVSQEQETELAIDINDLPLAATYDSVEHRNLYPLHA